LSLFAPYKLGLAELKNRIVMASMTRGRTTNPGHVPNELQVQYYRQRAGAGLILTEGTWVNRDAIGFINVPGLFTDAQIDGWRNVTDAVHDEGGVIFAQLAHSGAISHPDFFDGGLPLAPSAVNPGLRAFTSTGFKDTVTPRAMTVEEIQRTVGDYRAAAQNAQEAGFDGVELHCATTYLLPQFLNSELNIREDAYGGSPENRCRIVLEILNGLIEVWGPSRVGVKISPTMNQGGFRPTNATVETYDF
jgi:N-ethylmaleimide reductase